MTDETTSKEHNECSSLDRSGASTEPTEPVRLVDTDSPQTDERRAEELQSLGTGETTLSKKRTLQEETVEPTDEFAISDCSELYGRDQVRVRRIKVKIIEDE